MSGRAALALAFAFCALVLPTRPAGASLGAAQRAIVQHYVGALAARRYGEAFALLSPRDRRYFGTVADFESVFLTGGVRIASFEIVASKTSPAGTVALVRERIAFTDQRRGTTHAATANVAYGIVRVNGRFAIKDPYHPWRALAPSRLRAEANGVSVAVRSLSFYTGRLQLVATFANRAGRTVTFLPYGRSVLRDARGTSYPPIASKLPGLTDKTLYTGLRLPPSAEYTGLMTFLTPDRFQPGSLHLTIAPALLDGAERPFELAFPPVVIPR